MFFCDPPQKRIQDYFFYVYSLLHFSPHILIAFIFHKRQRLCMSKYQNQFTVFSIFSKSNRTENLKCKKMKNINSLLISFYYHYVFFMMYFMCYKAQTPCQFVSCFVQFTFIIIIAQVATRSSKWFFLMDGLLILLWQ